MINNDAVEAFNNRLTADLNNIKKMTPSQLDRVKEMGSQAENLLKNKDFAYFVHQFKFERVDVLTDIGGHTEADNSQRVALSNQLTGVDEFVKTLKRAVYFKNRVVSQQTGSTAPEDPIA
jgi:hypothetical protein